MRCGLLGRHLSHSYSPAIHAHFGAYPYVLYEKEPEQVEAFLLHGDFDALNVTIPYKKDAYRCCAELSDTAKRIGSVNTLVRKNDGTLYGDNTDVFGFAWLVRRSGLSVAGKKVLVLGNGGAATAVRAVLEDLRAGEIITISRSGEDNYKNLDRHTDCDIIVNTTPVGMYPNTGIAPVDLRKFPSCEGVLDLIYNPARTALLLQAEALGLVYADGLSMLVAQAARSAMRFTGCEISDERIDTVRQTLARSMQNIILVGMPGCGKTTVGRMLAEKLGRTLLDTDAWIVEQTGLCIPEIFKQGGEDAFRKLESQAICALGMQSASVICTGGGAVLREENYAPLHQNGSIVWLQRDLDKLPTDGRPISQANDLHALFDARRAYYERFADVIVSNDGTLDETVETILEVLG